MSELDPCDAAVLHELYAMGEKVGHRHDHDSRALVKRLDRAGLRSHHAWDALDRLENLGLVDNDGVRCRAHPGPAALALGLEQPTAVARAKRAAPRLRPSALAA